jgi:hypothetical protein
LTGAVDECRAKPPNDYQRIIICLTAGPRLGSELARRCGAVLNGPGLPLDSKSDSAVIVVEEAERCSREMLESIVFFVNRTRGVVALLAAMGSLAKWRARWRIQADQIRRRTHIIIQLDP